MPDSSAVHGSTAAGEPAEARREPDEAPRSTGAEAPIPILPSYYVDELGRKRFTRELFDHTAVDYEPVERLAGLGTGARYRKDALKRSGLEHGMKVLDVAAGTGLTARAAAELSGSAGSVVALDPSIEMLHQARKTSGMYFVQGTAEKLPCRDGQFDFLSMGYALRHLSDLRLAFHEFFRALKPSGRLCLLEISRPEGRLAGGALKLYMRTLVPWAAKFITSHPDSHLLMRFYWDTIEACVPPARIVTALADAGFENVKRHRHLGIFSEYVGIKPSAPK
jgi:demethylmenaquinone methyltransferase / 2-methoxy-6-polyprenyl-1,4-benzoquinol methylase